MYGTGISAEAVDKLKPQLANVMIDVRSGARLGIRGLIIEQIVADSPAEKAGLERNDRITEFAGRPIETFEQLTQEIAKCKPGETVAVKVLRGAETIDKTVTFDRWGDDERTTIDSPELQQGFVPQMRIQGNGRIIIQPQGRTIRIRPAQPLPERRR
jgi:membrane-associated protease RseP (regulator of RpoE activity)